MAQTPAITKSVDCILDQIRVRRNGAAYKESQISMHDVIVVGLGAFGSAAAYHLTRTGASVLGIDRYSPPHSQGSSHGETRVTRAAIGEGVEYSPLAIRSNQHWRTLEQETQQELYRRCGCLFIAGRPGGVMAPHAVPNFYANIRKAAADHNIQLAEFPSGDAVSRRFPQFKTVPEESGVLDPEGGFLFPERCIRAQLTLAQQRGAKLLTNTVVTGYDENPNGVQVQTQDGARHQASKLLLTAGSWLPKLVGSPLGGARVTRQTLHWFELSGDPEPFDPARCPTYIWLVDRPSVVYGFPFVGDPSNGIKIAHEEEGGTGDPDTLSRNVAAAEIDYVYETYVQPFFTGIGRRSLRAEVCLYTSLKNARFIIDWMPGSKRILFASACSGHGFKHSAAVGEGLAKLLMPTMDAEIDLSDFTLAEYQRRT
jgi:sarcosine oxidase